MYSKNFSNLNKIFKKLLLKFGPVLESKHELFNIACPTRVLLDTLSFIHLVYKLSHLIILCLFLSHLFIH